MPPLVSEAVPAMHRRAFLTHSLAGLSLPTLLAARAARGAPRRERTALIVVWLQGGASHLETYDPKPDAPSEVRGPYGSIATNVEGMRVSELLPRHVRIADKFSLLRSLSHTGFCHQQGNQQMFTGHPELTLRIDPEHPDLMCIANHLRADGARRLPAYVGVNPIPYLGPAYLGTARGPYAVHGDPNVEGFRVAELGRKTGNELGRMQHRHALRLGFQQVGASPIDPASTRAFEAFHEQAHAMLTSPEAQRAFDLELEDPRLRDRYGRNTWGQRCLMARRLVEAGVDLVTTSLDGPLCGRVGNWDDHAVNHHIFDAMKSRCLVFDQAVSALIEDIHARGLNERVLVVVTGEFGRTPKITYEPDSASGARQPGRDHWPAAVSLLFSGGGVSGGQVIGATNRTGADVVRRRVRVRDFLATIYRHLQIDAQRIALTDMAGRPVPILPEGEPIAELVSQLG